jgi:hypothetical protein
VLSDEGGTDDGSSAGGAEMGNDDDSNRHFPLHEMETILRKLDLAYIVEEIMPSLNGASMEILKDTMKKNMKKTKANQELANADGEVFQRGRLDYVSTVAKRSMPRPDTISESPPEVPRRLREIDADNETPGRTIKVTMDYFLLLVETVLTFQACLKYSGAHLSRGDNLRKFATAVETLRKAVAEATNRGAKTNGWKTEKHVELSHFIADFKEFGVPSGYSTETGERGLKQWAKRPANTAQKRSDEIFSGQTCSRIHDTNILDQLTRVIGARRGDNNYAKEQKKKGATPSTTFVYMKNAREPAGGIWRVLPDGKRERATETMYPQEILTWFKNNYHDTASCRVYIFTELRKSQEDGSEGVDGVIFRAHPNYRQQGAWFDYGTIKYELVDERTGEVSEEDWPVRIAAFFQEVGQTVQDRSPMRMLVQECNWQTRAEKNMKSMVFEHYSLAGEWDDDNHERFRATLTEKSVDTLNSRVYCLETVPGGEVF